MIISLLNTLLILLLISNLQIFAQAKNGTFDEIKNSISMDAVKRHLQFLGSDLFEGRGTGTMGGNLAAKYLALEFDQLNLIPIGDENTYYQYIQMHGSFPNQNSELNLFFNDEKIELKLWEDYLLYRSGEQTFIPNQLPLVFVGYGIIAPEFDYNDYQLIDVAGKIVVCLSGEPNSDNENFFDADEPTIYSTPDAKQRIALSRGARGCIIIPKELIGKPKEWIAKQNLFSFEDVTLAYRVTSNLSLVINPVTANKLFLGSQFSLNDILLKHENNSIKSFELKTKLSFSGDFSERDFVAPNIVGMIEGSDRELKDTYVLVSAHYDAFGIGKAIQGDSIYNGVFDNAIGTSVLIEIAKAFTQLNERPKRSIIFLLTTGEEKGLLGSTYYADHAIFPLYKTIANVNIDGIAYLDKFKTLIGVGKELSTLEENLIQVAKKNNLSIQQIPAMFRQTEALSRSDQWAFARAGIPAILIMDGTEYVNIDSKEGIISLINFQNKYYHSPFDDLTLPINYDAVNQHAQILFEFIYTLANSEIEPEWRKGSPFINARLRSRAEKF